MEKIDLKKQLKHLYQPPTRAVVEVDVPTMNFLMIDGEGNPNTAQRYKDAVAALYAVAYTLKFMVKKGELAIDYGVMPLEGLWWVDEGTSYSMDDKDSWKWTMLIMQPEFVTPELFEQARNEARKKKPEAPIDDVRFAPFHEGQSVQIMHIGPYADEESTMVKIFGYCKAHGLKRGGKHHEIYLSDPNRAAPEKMQTILREPVMV